MRVVTQCLSALIRLYMAHARAGDCISGVADVITSHGNDEFLLSLSPVASCLDPSSHAAAATAAAAGRTTHELGNGRGCSRRTHPARERVIYVS